MPTMSLSRSAPGGANTPVDLPARSRPRTVLSSGTPNGFVARSSGGESPELVFQRPFGARTWSRSENVYIGIAAAQLRATPEAVRHGTRRPSCWDLHGSGPSSGGTGSAPHTTSLRRLAAANVGA